MAKRNFHLTPDEVSGLWQAYDHADDPKNSAIGSGTIVRRRGWREGNRPHLIQEQREQIEAMVRQSPPNQVLGRHQRRHDTPFWTVEDLMVVVEDKYGELYYKSTSYLALVHESGLSVSGSVSVSVPDPPTRRLLRRKLN